MNKDLKTKLGIYLTKMFCFASLQPTTFSSSRNEIRDRLRQRLQKKVHLCLLGYVITYTCIVQVSQLGTVCECQLALEQSNLSAL